MEKLGREAGVMMIRKLFTEEREILISRVKEVDGVPAETYYAWWPKFVDDQLSPGICVQKETPSASLNGGSFETFSTRAIATGRTLSTF